MGVFLISFASATQVILGDHGANVKDSSGNLLGLGNLTILIYESQNGSDLIYNNTFVGGIVDGGWNVQISAELEYGNSYWKDYEINLDNLNFSGADRLEFHSPLGYINNNSFVNFSLIESCSEGSAIQGIYSNGSVVCEIDDDTTYSHLSEFIDDLGNGNWTLDKTNYYDKTEIDDLDYSEKNVNSSVYSDSANSTTWWAGLFGWVTDWFVNDGGKLGFNEAKLNETIDSRGGIDTDTHVRGDGYLYNNSDTMYLDETKLNATIDSRDSDTTYSDLSEFTDDIGVNEKTDYDFGSNDFDGSGDFVTSGDLSGNVIYIGSNWRMMEVNGNLSIQSNNGTHWVESTEFAPAEIEECHFDEDCWGL